MRLSPFRIPRRALASACSVMLLALLGCRESPTAGVPREPAFMTGRITRVGETWGFLVEGTPGTDYRVDKAYVGVGGSTAILRRDGERATTAELTVGRALSLWITGPILESYPVQVQARVVVLEPDATQTRR